MTYASPPAPEVTTSDAAAGLDQGGTLIDVREPDEFASGHIPEAVSMPLGEVLERYQELDQTRMVFVVCAVGARSMAVAGALRQLGFDAVSIAGGTSLWRSEGRADLNRLGERSQSGVSGDAG